MLERNGVGRSVRNVAHHYDLSDRLYDLFLDVDRQYSCSYWPDPGHETLEQAQSDKKHHIAAKLLAEPSQRVLEMRGSGGGIASSLIRVDDVHVQGIPPLAEKSPALRRAGQARGAESAEERIP